MIRFLFPVKNIIFDLGGVILEIDTQRSIDAFRRLGFGNFEEIFTRFKQNELFDKLEKGQIKPNIFRNEIRKYISKNVTDHEIDTAWNAMLLGFPSERIGLLKKLKKYYRTFLLSNTNEIHLESYFSILKENFGLENLSTLFEKEYYSHQIGMKKPGIEIFKFVLTTSNLIAKETLFIDDTPQNIEVAKKTGMFVYLLKEDETIIDLFKE